MKPLFNFLLLLSITCILACNNGNNNSSKISEAFLLQPDFVNQEVTKLIETQLSNLDTLQPFLIDADTLYAGKQIFEFYKKNNFNPVWTNNGIHLKQSDSLVLVIKNSEEYGLISDDYHYTKIVSLLAAEKNSKTNKFDAVKISEAEILLTDAFFTLAVHVNKGRLDSETLQRKWKVKMLDTNLVSLLENAFKLNLIKPTINSLEPKSREYKALKYELNRFCAEFKNIFWDSLIKPEFDTATFNERLQKRLVASHDYVEEPGVPQSILLSNAIKNIQYKNNLDKDGKIGQLTYKVLQETKQDYIQKIEMNMERWRYYEMPKDSEYVWVNIPKYQLQVIEKDTLVMKSSVIVGAAKTPTPLLKATIRYFIIYPYWTVPHSIATKEILPKLKRDKNYLVKERFDVLDRNRTIITSPINWNKYSKNNFPFHLRQRIGEDNSLGILKFNFNNTYGIYLHDTNNHKLFKKQNRAMSHGCIRLEEYGNFAKFLIRDDSARYPLDSLNVDLLKEKQKYVYLKRPIPIYINYFTAEVDNNNELFYFIDVYKRDEEMIKVLYKHK